MKIYIASSLKNADNVRKVRDILIEKGHTITYDWTTHGLVADTTKLADIAFKEFQGVVQCDALVVLSPTGYGTHVEMGIALATAKPIHFYRPEDGSELKSFYFMKNVTRYADLDSLLSQF
jgi:nucleoside 2-deoxyribosyltransferase